MNYVCDHLNRAMLVGVCFLAGCDHRQPTDYDYTNMDLPDRVRQSGASSTSLTSVSAAPSKEQSQDVDANTVLNFDDGAANSAYPPLGLWPDANQAMAEGNGSASTKPSHN